MYLTGWTFCQFWHFLGLTLKNFSDFVPDRDQISPKCCLLGYEFCQKFVSDRVHFSNSSGTSPSVVKVSAPPGSYREAKQPDIYSSDQKNCSKLLRRHSSYGGSSFGDSTVYSAKGPFRRLFFWIGLGLFYQEVFESLNTLWDRFFSELIFAVC